MDPRDLAAHLLTTLIGVQLLSKTSTDPDLLALGADRLPVLTRHGAIVGVHVHLPSLRFEGKVAW